LPELHTLKRTLVTDEVQRALKAYIAENGLRPGQALPTEGELARQFGVSRSSVREAVKSLEGLGILESRVGSGIYVRKFSFDPILDNLSYGLLTELTHLQDVLEVRLHLESGMAERVVGECDEAQLERLRAILRSWDVESLAGRYSPTLDRTFHGALLGTVDNPLVGRILDLFWDVFSRASSTAALAGPSDPRETYNRHVPILKGLEDQDAEATQAAIRAHYSGLVERVRVAKQTSEE
jgi:DNA-binding FadR family transcriptional regulator